MTGFVDYETVEQATEALRERVRTEFQGRLITVKYAKQKNSNDRSWPIIARHHPSLH
jgi:RNA recognition motif-containing protein